MRFQFRLNFIAIVVAAFTYLSMGFAQTVPSHAEQQPQGKRPFSGHYFHVSTPDSRPNSNAITIDSESIGNVSGMRTFTMKMPSDADPHALHVTLNGKDVSDLFHASGCGGAVCALATLYPQDGISPVKNVLTASVKLSSGGFASGRWRGMNVPSGKKNGIRLAVPRSMVKSNGLTSLPMASAASAVCDPVNMCPAWLPPSVRFDTLTPGGWTLGANPWISVNGIGYGFYGGTVASPHYAMVALDRQTLQLVDWEWFATGTDFTTYLKKLPSTDLVIAGTTALSGNSLYSDVDTTTIGGTDFSKWQGAYPGSYVVIGYPGQTAGTAYENTRSANAFATGSLLEDANGNYNFQSSDIVEYAIEPQDPGNYGNPDIVMSVPTNLSVNGESSIEILANATAGQNGLWLLVLDRTTLMPAYNPDSSGKSPCSDTNLGYGATRVVVNCGTFYPVGAANNDISDQWQALANALSAVTTDQIVFLQSIGVVGLGNLATTVGSQGGFGPFNQAIANFGGNSYAVAGPTFSTQDNYALVSFPGAGGPLTGGAAELSTAYSGQRGVLHGTLQRDRNGLYRPAQSSPEQQGLFSAKGGINDSDFTLGIASYQQPVAWPSNSAVTLLPGASSIPGQQAAYRFVSHWLLAGYYMKTIQGPHQDDIHFFFSGSTNTSINYQTMDPANLPSLGAGSWTSFGCTSFDGTTCTFQAPGDSAASSFTVNDYNSVKAQLSLEVIYLTNTLQYLVTGSTNLKDIVASGSANVGLALSAAANTIEGSGMGNLNAQQIAQKQVTFSWQSLLGFLGGVAQTVADVEGVGELTPVWSTLTEATQKQLKAVTSSANAIGALVATIGSGGGIRTSTSSLVSSPQPFAQLTSTVGELATQNLQSPLIVGFDTTADNITSDWGRLSTIGPRTTNTNDTTFFAPDQVSQVTAINALTNASASTFYFSLLPDFYNVHVWNGVTASSSPSNAFQPTVGRLSEHTEYDSCNAFYLTPNSNTANSSLGTLNLYTGQRLPSIVGTQSPFSQDEGYIDFRVIDSTVSKAGTSSTNIAVIDGDLANSLFAPDQLNVPLLEFLSAVGPMRGVTKDASIDRISGFSNGDICDASDPDYNPSSGGGLTSPSPNGKTVTTTTLTGATSGVLGHDMVLAARVMASGQPVPSGLVFLSVDGTVVANPAVAPDGTASFTVSKGLALGSHQIQADYAPGAGSTYATSAAPPVTFVVYSESADISLAVPSTTTNVSYTATSSPVTVQIGSIAGLAGNVALSCTGLPVGLGCTFNAPSMALVANGNITATVQIGPNTSAHTEPGISTLGKATLAFVMLPMLGIGGLRKRNQVVRLAMLLILTAGVATLVLTGCSGGSLTPAPTTTRETGTKTITINANIGSVSRSAPMTINIQ